MAVSQHELYKLSATQAAGLIRTNQLSAQDYAKALLDRVRERDPQVRAWAYLDENAILKQARKLDALPPEKRGPLHGIAVGIKDIFLTRDMPTKYYSRLHAQDGNAAADSACVSVLRAAGAIIFGKTATTEFASMTEGSPCANPHNSRHTPGGSSSGSAAAVADFQVPLSIGTQTGGSVVRPASFNGVYGFKPTWGTVSTEGTSIVSVSADTPGFYARSVDDLEFLAHLFRLDALLTEPLHPLSIIGARIAFVKTHIWPEAQSGTRAAWNLAHRLLAETGAKVEHVELPERFGNCPEWREIVVAEEARAAYLPKYLQDQTKLHADIVALVESTNVPSRKKLLEAHDGIARLRREWDLIASQYDIIITPSAIDEAPEGLESTGTAACLLPAGLLWLYRR
ncbi:amidase domain protein [Metarhizium robertsii]|uniref:Amidase family protein n=2 Tax=Metarhizium robertsii TaxID=568076 RepID=E9F416_METRA|nr:Amidase family protein [Metarhizium robertsii ARSEF 23]EFY97373.2 Amidase family protein [Metarhizium robertsii ARSEF 23]EXU96831.1 amidase domain protein [Metarhizium robertsii]